MTLNLEAFGERPKKSNSKYKAALGVSSVVGLFGIGSTLAANISLNGGGNVEFGQGVATTAACDEDGFTITPVTSFDNQQGIFRVEYVEVSGVNLTPQGSIVGQVTYEEAGVTDQNESGTVTQEDAKIQFPGQYYDVSEWKRTCDNVVLDFKAYTDDEEYLLYTDDAYDGSGPGSLTSPVGWAQDFIYGALDMAYSPGFALIIDSYDDGSDYDYNFGVDIVDVTDWHGDSGQMYFSIADNPASVVSSNSEFQIRWNYAGIRPNAASISKITVQSMASFPYTYDPHTTNGIGNPSDENWPIT
jgi:hypothetical protein